MHSYFNEQKLDQMGSSRIMLDGATPYVDPKVGSNSEVLIQSEISNMESMRSIKQETKPPKLVKNDSYAIRFNSSMQHSKQEQLHVSSSFKHAEQNEKNEKLEKDDRLKQVLVKQRLLKFKDNLISSANILTKQMWQDKKQLFQNLFLDFETKEIRQSKKQQPTGKLQKFLFFEVFRPQDRFTKIWNFFSIIFSLFTLWLSPFVNSFKLSNQSEISRLIEIILIYILIDGLVTCNKAILVQGELIVNRKIIVRKFLRYQVAYEFLNLIIWIIIYIGANQYIINEIISIIQVFLIVKSVYQKVNSFMDCLFLNGSLSEVLDLFFLILSLSYFIHIIACLWHYMSVISEEMHKMSWIQKYQLEQENYWIQYDYSIYWATMTMVTVGYGDITAANDIEIAFSNLTMFISSFVFAYSMNSIGMIIKNLNDAKSMYKRQLISINTYMKHNLVDVSIQNRVRNYLKNQVDLENSNNQSEAQQIIDNLPERLKNDMNFNIRTRIMKNIKILTENFSQVTLAQATTLFELLSFIPNDTIYKPEETSQDQYLFYLDQGSASLVEIRTQKVIQKYQEGESFGEYSFISGKDQKFMIVATEFCQLYRISRNQFQKILQSCQKDKELFHSIKDQLIYTSDCSLLSKKCNLCQKMDHQNYNCFVISYKPNLEKIIKKEEFIQQDRKSSVRSNKLRINTIFQIKGVQETVLDFQQQELYTNQNDSGTVVSETKRNQTMRRQSEQPDSHENLSSHENSPDFKQEKLELYLKQQQQQQLDIRRRSQSKSKFVGLHQSNKHIQLQQDNHDLSQNRKPSLMLKEATVINTEIPSQQIIQIKSLKNISNTVLMELEDNAKVFKSLNLEVDKVYNYQYYMPQYNISNVIVNYNKQKAKFQTLFLTNIKKSQKYTFYFKIAKLAVGIRQKLSPQKRNTKLNIQRKPKEKLLPF